MFVPVPREEGEENPGISWGSGGGSVGTPRWSLLSFQVPVAGEGEAAALLEQELGTGDSRELRGIPRKGNYEAITPLGEDPSDHVRSIIIPGLMQLPNPPHMEHGGIPGDMSCSQCSCTVFSWDMDCTWITLQGFAVESPTF